MTETVWPTKPKISGPLRKSLLTDNLAHSNLTWFLEFCTLNSVFEGLFFIVVLEAVFLIYLLKPLLEPCRKNISTLEKAVHTKILHRQLVGLISNICCLFCV